MELHDSNVLEYVLADGSKIPVCPSCNEPKVKVYFLIHCATMISCKERCAKFAAWAESLKN